MSRQTLLQRAEAFDREHPEVFDHLRTLALKAVDAGHGKLGIGQLFEVLRWERMLSARDADGFKLNNDFRAYYSRRLMAEVPGLEGVFETRESKVDVPPAAPAAGTLLAADEGNALEGNALASAYDLDDGDEWWLA